MNSEVHVTTSRIAQRPPGNNPEHTASVHTKEKMREEKEARLRCGAILMMLFLMLPLCGLFAEIMCGMTSAKAKPEPVSVTIEDIQQIVTGGEKYDLPGLMDT